MKSGNLNFLEPSGPLQACNGTALFIYKLIIKFSASSWLILINILRCTVSKILKNRFNQYRFKATQEIRTDLQYQRFEELLYPYNKSINK